MIMLTTRRCSNDGGYASHVIPVPRLSCCCRFANQFADLCENAGLAYLMSHQVPQYRNLTYYFVNWFKFNDGLFLTIEFRYYEETLTMTVAKFCETLGVQNIGKTER